MAKSKQAGHNNASTRDKPSEAKQEPVIGGSERLKDVRQELFCQNRVQGMSQARAYREAGYSSNGDDGNACRLIVNDSRIRARIDYLRDRSLERLEITRIGQAKKLEDCRRRCEGQDDNSSEIAAIKEQDKLFGLSIDKTITEQSDEQKQLSALEAQAAADHAEFALWKARRDAKRTRGADSAAQGEIADPGANEFSTEGSDNGDIEPITGVD